MTFCIFKYGLQCNLSDVIFIFYNCYAHLIMCTWNLRTKSIKLLLLLLLLLLIIIENDISNDNNFECPFWFSFLSL